MDDAAVAAELDAAFRATLERELNVPGTQAPPPDWPLHVPAPLVGTIIGATRLAGGQVPGALTEYYSNRMPSQLVDQFFRSGGQRELLRQEHLQARPGSAFAGAIRGLFDVLARAKVDAGAVTGHSSAEALLRAGPSVAKVYAHSLFGSGLPFLGAHPAERRLLARERERGRAPDELLDWRTAGNLVHELCHGRRPRSRAAPVPWMLSEAAAIHLGAAAWPRHIFPEIPGEAVPGVSLFALLGDGLARQYGEGALWSLVAGSSTSDALGTRAAATFGAAGWQDWANRLLPPFAPHALQAVEWAKLGDAARGASPLSSLVDRAAAIEPTDATELASLPDLASAAAATAWSELPWWKEDPTQADVAMVARGVDAACQVNVMADGLFETHPSEPPGGELRVELEKCLILARKRPEGVFGEPARWLFPPPLARLLVGRGARTIAIEGASRRSRRAIASALIDLAAGHSRLDPEVRLRWASSPRA